MIASRRTVASGRRVRFLTTCRFLGDHNGHWISMRRAHAEYLRICEVLVPYTATCCNWEG